MVAVLARSAVTAYADEVIAGRIVCGNLVRLACQRHVRDLAEGEARGLYFDEDAAQRAIQFFDFLPHIKGEWASGAGRLTLQPWQAFIVGSLFGWKRADGTRRFRTAYNELARKNGKSTMAAGIGLMLAFFDAEPGAEVYSAATKKDQAKIVWNDASNMVKRTPALRARIKPFRDNLHSDATASKFEPLGADADTLDGLNIHGAIVDELHAHPNRKVVDVLETATGARRQPLLFYITTAGFDRHSVCWSHRDYSTRVLEGIVEDDSWFAFIAALDEGDDWRDPAVWPKANPNYGVSVKPEDMADKAKRAQEMPTAEQEFRRKHLTQWTESETRWLSLEAWDACGGAVDESSLIGRRCFGGLDLSSTADLTALALVFPDDDGGYDVVIRAWAPADNIRKRAEKDRVPYLVWRDQGLLTATAGNVVDYDFIEATLAADAERYQLEEVAIDRWNSTGTQTHLMTAGITVVPFGQGFASMTAPTKELERLVMAGKIRHGGNPLLRWCASNVVVLTDPAGNIKPDKDKSTERIDPMVALVMAIGRAIVHAPEVSVYESRGVRTL